MTVENFFAYFPVAPKMQSFGVYATSFGTGRIPAHSDYPPGGHPATHRFDWSRGRTLQVYQFVLIREGGGYFESAFTKIRKVEANSLFILFPGVWHRFRPDPSTGWFESWMELQGPQMDHYLHAGFINPRKGLFRNVSFEVAAAFDEALRLSRARTLGFPVRIALQGLQIVSCLNWKPSALRTAERRTQNLISEAQELLAGNLESHISIEDIAQKLGLGYSLFRTTFKRQTGFSPKQYQNEVRNRRAMELLRHTTKSVKEIAESLGFSSPYHLSREFSRRNGVSPAIWRRSI